MKLENTLKKILIVGIFLIPFISLVVASGISVSSAEYGMAKFLGNVLTMPFVSGMFFPFITGKNFIFRIIVEVLLGVYIILAYRNSTYRPKKTFILTALISFISIIAIADIFGADPYRSFWSNYERMEGFIGLLHLFAYFLITTAVLNTEKLWKRFFNMSLFVSIIIGVYGLFQLSGALVINQGGARVDGTFGNATYLAIYNLFNIFIAAFLLSKSWRWVSSRVFYIATIALNVFMLFYTASRGVILGLLGGAIVSAFLIALFERKNLKTRNWSIGILVAIAILISGFISIKETSFVKNSEVLSRLATISIEGGSARFMVWNMAIKGFKENPILGWGQENFNFVFNKYYDPGMYAQEQWFDRAHNIFFDWLIAGGVLGLVAYLSLFASAFYLLWVKDRDMSVTGKSILTGLLVGYFFQNLFVFDNIMSYVMFFSVLGYIHSSNNRSTDEGVIKKIKKVFSHDHSNKNRLSNVLVAPATILLVIFSLYFVNYKPIVANRTIIKALTPSKDGVEQNLNLFKKAIAYNSFGNQEAREQLQRVTFAVARTPDVSEDLKNRFIDFTDTQMKLKIEASPNDARHHLFYAIFLDGFGRFNDAMIHFNKALELSPNKQQIYFDMTNSYLKREDIKKALELAKTAYFLDTNYEQARIIYAVVSIFNGDESLASELLLPVPKNTILNDDRFIQAYASIGNYSKIIDIWKERIKGNPENKQYRLSLAASYLNNGQREKAIQEIIDIIKDNPEFEKQGQYYINEIRAGRTPSN